MEEVGLCGSGTREALVNGTRRGRGIGEGCTFLDIPLALCTLIAFAVLITASAAWVLTDVSDSIDAFELYRDNGTREPLDQIDNGLQWTYLWIGLGLDSGQSEQGSRMTRMCDG